MDPLKLITLCHEHAHEAEHDPQDTVMCALTRRDVWLFCLAMLLLRQSTDCLEEEIEDLLTRIAELAEVQKLNWRTNGG